MDADAEALETIIEMKKVEIEEKKILNEQKKADSWAICCSRSSPEAIKYMVHCGLATLVISFSIGMIISRPDADNTVYWSSLSATLGWIMPSPSLTTDARE